MWADLVRERSGVPLASLAEASEAELADATLVAVVCRDDDVLPAVAALTPAQAAAYLCLFDDDAESAGANAFLERLDASGTDSYLLKSGRVGGVDPDRSLEIHADHAAAILDGISAGAIEWEEDLDFGYRIASRVPGIEGRDRLVLVPRFLYARTERVYEYAATVPELRRRRVARLSALAGLAPEIIDAVR